MASTFWVTVNSITTFTIKELVTVTTEYKIALSMPHNIMSQSSPPNKKQVACSGRSKYYYRHKFADWGQIIFRFWEVLIMVFDSRWHTEFVVVVKP